VATTLEQVAAELYALPPAEFTAQRAARAKALRPEDAELAAAVSRRWPSSVSSHRKESRSTPPS
jgi:hypothetical protein